MNRPSFLDQQPPPGYIAGVGRGATGFSTRGEVTKMGKTPRRLQDGSNGSPSNVDDTTTYIGAKEENLEAEEAFAAVDAKLAARNRSIKSPVVNQNASGDISQQFADLKRSLAHVSEEEWLNIPEAGDITKRHKRERIQDQLNRKEYAAPDSLVQSTANVNLSKLTEEREKLLVSHLDSGLLDRDKTDEVELTKTKAYLNELELATTSNIISSSDQDEDLKKMRDILLLYRKADPTRPEGWIASARLEEKARRLKTAKNLINQACQKCPKNEDVWLENLRLNTSDSILCKSMVAEAISNNPTSLTLWMKAVELETESFNKCRVIRKALQQIPHSEELWTAIVKYEANKAERERILQKAVEFVPRSLEIWRTLVHSQDYPNAKISLNKMRKLLPKEIEVWILAAQVEEHLNSQLTVERLGGLLNKGRNELAKLDIFISFSEWLNHAEKLERDLESPKVAESIVFIAIQEETNKESKPSPTKLVQNMADSPIKIIALRALLEKSPTDFNLWKHLKSTCEKLKRMNELYMTFETILFKKHDSAALEENPVLALMYSKEIWKYAKDAARALEILDRAIQALPTTLDIWLAKIKILLLSSLFEEAKKTFLDALKIFESTKTFAGLERLYYKYVSFLRFRQQNSEALLFIENSAQERFPACPIFQIQKGQILQDIGSIEKCREAFSTGTKLFPNCAVLWILLAEVDEVGLGKPTKARSDLDIAVLKNPHEESLFLAKIKLEIRLGNLDQARLIVSQSLQKFQKSAKLWSENIRLLPSKKSSFKKTIFQDALKNTSSSCEVLLEIGISFYKDSQYSTALKWFERATVKNKLYGDAWVWLTRCRQKLQEEYGDCYKNVLEHEPTYGDEWISVSKNMSTQYSTPNTILKMLAP